MEHPWSLWSLHGACMEEVEPPWSLHGAYVDSMENMEFPWSLRGRNLVNGDYFASTETPAEPPGNLQLCTQSVLGTVVLRLGGSISSFHGGLHGRNRASVHGGIETMEVYFAFTDSSWRLHGGPMEHSTGEKGPTWSLDGDSMVELGSMEAPLLPWNPRGGSTGITRKKWSLPRRIQQCSTQRPTELAIPSAYSMIRIS